MLRFAIALLGLAACGGDSETGPVDITLDNLEGYWVVSSAESWLPRPGALHIGVVPYPGEAPPEHTKVAEVLRMAGGEGTVAAYELVGTTLELAGPNNFEGVLEIDSLTRDTLVGRFDGKSVTLTRQSDCAGPGFWMGGFSEVYDAAWDGWGGLHVITSVPGGAVVYGFVAPGRCLITVPEAPADATLPQSTIDIADNGDVRLLQFARDGSAPGAIRVATIPAKPWARASLDVTETSIPAPSTPAIHAPVRSIEVDGELVVFYADGLNLYAATATSETALTLPNGSTFTPGLLTISHLPDGSWVVRAANFREGLRYVDGAFQPWTAERIDIAAGDATFADVFAYDGDTLYAAWTEVPAGSTPSLIVGRKVDGAWQRVTAGQGRATALRVADGVIDIIGPLDDEGLGPMAWTHLPRFAENVWQQEYQLSFEGTIDFALPRTAAASGLFGPDGEVFMAVRGAVWRRPAAETGELYRWNQVDLKFVSELPAAVSFPTLGERCEADCSFATPTSAIFPAVLELPDESAAAQLVGARATPTKDSYAVQVNTSVVIEYGPTELRLETTERRMTPVALGPDEAQSSAGTAVAYPGGFATTRLGSGVVLSKIEGGAVVDEVTLDGFEAGRLHVRPDGGFVLPLSPPTLAHTGVGIVSSDLELVGEVPFPDLQRPYVLTDDGFIMFAYEGQTLVFSAYSESGVSPPVPSPVAETDVLLALGDGFVAFDPLAGVWRKVGLDGAVDWTLTGQRSANLVWNVIDGDLVVTTDIGATFTIGGVTYRGSGDSGEEPVMHFVGRFDGATGRLKTQRVTPLLWNNGLVQPTGVSADENGVLLSEVFGPILLMAYVPWSGPVVLRDYGADVEAGYCMPTNFCRLSATSFVPVGNGRFGGVWTQVATTNYDGAVVESATKKAVAGTFVPNP